VRKPRRILLVTLLIALLGFVSWLLLSQPVEPAYQGKPLNFWCFQYASNSFSHPDGQAAKQAEIAIRTIGTNAVPTLLRWFTAEDSEFKRKLIQFTRRKLFININWRQAELKHFEAEFGFRCLGSDGASAIPSLIKIYEDPSYVPRSYLHFASARALGDIHAKPALTVPILTRALHDPDESVREVAASSLAAFGNDAKSAVPELIKTLADPDSDVRNEAASTLQKIHPVAAANAGVK